MDEEESGAYIAEENRGAVREKPGQNTAPTGKKVYRGGAERQEERRGLERIPCEKAASGPEDESRCREKENACALENRGAAPCELVPVTEKYISEIAANREIKTAVDRENVAEPCNEAGIVCAMERPPERLCGKAEQYLQREQDGYRAERI